MPRDDREDTSITPSSQLEIADGSTSTQGMQPRPPPDGGYGWICVAAQFLINGFTWGVAASYSVYLSHYLSQGLFSEARPLDYAFVGGFNFAFALLVAPLATSLARRYGARAPMLGGVVLLPAGFIAASFAQRVWHLYLSQGLCVGLGIGLVYIPAAAIVPQWFARRRSLASGLCAAGSGVGGLAVCFATRAMLDDDGGIGYVWSLRVTAAVVFVANLAAALLVRSRDAEIRPDARAFPLGLLARSHPARLLLGWSFVSMFGYITLMFSLSDYAKGPLGRSDRDAAAVPALLNLGAALGRPLIGYASDRLGRVEVAGVLTFACGALIFGLWLPFTAYPALGVFATISGAILGIFWAASGNMFFLVACFTTLCSHKTVNWCPRRGSRWVEGAACFSKHDVDHRRATMSLCGSDCIGTQTCYLRNTILYLRADICWHLLHIVKSSIA
ncbi:hypothetical protein PG990_000200 [Apiospora arundinis]